MDSDVPSSMTRGPLGLHEGALHEAHAGSILGHAAGALRLSQAGGPAAGSGNHLEEFMDRFCPPGNATRMESDLLPGFAFTIHQNGLIRVAHGDWISKYTALLEGNLLTGWDNFLRWNEELRTVVHVENPNRIEAGEALFYKPYYIRAVGRLPERIRERNMDRAVEGEIGRMREDVIKRVARDFKLTPQEYTWVRDTLVALDWGGQALRMAGTVAAVAGSAGAATAFTAAGAFGIPIGGILGLFKMAKSWEFGFEIVGFKAAAYAWVVFAYGPRNLPEPRAKIQVPSFERAYAAHWGGPSERSRRDAEKARKAWRKGFQDGIAAMKAQVDAFTDRFVSSRDAARFLREADLSTEDFAAMEPHARHARLRQEMQLFFTRVAQELVVRMGGGNPERSLNALFDQITAHLKKGNIVGLKDLPAILKMLESDNQDLPWPVPRDWPA